MRVTQSIITRNLLESINRNRENMDTIQRKISTGKQILKPSDNPRGYLRSNRFRETIDRNEQYIENITNAHEWVDNSLQILTQMEDQVVEAKEIAIQAADLSHQYERDELADRVDGIIEDMVSLGNSSHIGKYVFGGTLTKGDDPFAYDGTVATYQGNSDKITRGIGENQNVEINITGQELVDTGIFQHLIELRDGLQNNDTAAINQSIQDLKSVDNQLLNLTSVTGTLLSQLDMTRQRLETANVNLASQLSETEDADILEAIAQYTMEELAYKTALRTTSETLNLNLLDYLR